MNAGRGGVGWVPNAIPELAAICVIDDRQNQIFDYLWLLHVAIN